MNIVIPHGFESNYTMGFVRGIAANGVPCLVVSDDDIAPRLELAGIPHVNLRGSTSERRSGFAKGWNLVRYYVRLLWLLVRHRDSVVHFTGIYRNELVFWEACLLPVLLRLLSGRFIYTAHNVLPHSRRSSRLFHAAYRWAYRWPHVIVAHTRKTADEIAHRFGVPAEKLTCISIGLNEEMPLSDLSRDAARQRLGLDESRPAILFFGKIVPYKGLDRLLTAFDTLPVPRSMLVIAGAFDNGRYREEILAQISGLRRRDSVLLLDRSIPNDEVEVLFKACDVLCLPYRDIYQSGLVFLAPRFGLPIVATPVGSLPEFIEPNLGNITATNDVAGIRAGLEQFFREPGAARRDAIAAHGQTFRWPVVIEPVLSFYHHSPTQYAAHPPRVPAPHTTLR